MIAVDTSSFVAFIQGDKGQDVDLVREAVREESLIMIPFVLAELFSAPDLSEELKDLIRRLPAKRVKNGFWERAGEARATILKNGKKARALDTMIAIYCIDCQIPLIARDSDYRHFVEHFGLDLRPFRLNE